MEYSSHVYGASKNHSIGIGFSYSYLVGDDDAIQLTGSSY